MALAYRSTNSLTWLISCSIFNKNILIWCCPSLPLEASGLKNALVQIYQMVPLGKRFLYLIEKIKSLLVELINPRSLSTRHVDDPDLLLGYSSILHDSSEGVWSNPSTKMPMEVPASLLYAVACPLLKCLRAGDIVNHFTSQIVVLQNWKEQKASTSSFWWFNLLLLLDWCKSPVPPLDSLKWDVEKLGHDWPGQQWLSAALLKLVSISKKVSASSGIKSVRCF